MSFKKSVFIQNCATENVGEKLEKTVGCTRQSLLYSSLLLVIENKISISHGNQCPSVCTSFVATGAAGSTAWHTALKPVPAAFSSLQIM